MNNMKKMEYELKRSDLCLCGSGKRFGQCCFNYIDSRESDIKRHMDNGDYVKAFKSLNGQLTNYLVKVIRHTKQALLEKQNEAANAWLIIDINAIDEIVTRLIRIACDSKQIIDFEKRLQSISNIFEVEPWKQRLLFLQVLYYDLMGEGNVCKRLLKDVVIENVVDKDLLQIYYQIMADNMGIGEIEALLNKIVALEHRKVIKMKYKFSLALHYLFNLDENTAKNIAISIIDELSDIKKPSDFLERSIIADIYSFYGEMMDDDSYVQKAIDEYLSLSEDPGLTSSGKSKYLIDIGRLYMLLGKYGLSLNCLEESKTIYYDPLADIYIGDVYIRQRNKEKAREILYDISLVSVHNKIDYLLTITRLLLI